jgi:hypothetical protein
VGSAMSLMRFLLKMASPGWLASGIKLSDLDRTWTAEKRKRQTPARATRLTGSSYLRWGLVSPPPMRSIRSR